jgi:hypothetical protein
MYIYVCPIPNGSRDSAISRYSSNIFSTKTILRTVSNTGTYCSGDKVGAVYKVQHIFENSTININALCNSCEDMACCSSECILTLFYARDNIHTFISETVRNKDTCTYMLFCLEWPTLRHPGTPCISDILHSSTLYKGALKHYSGFVLWHEGSEPNRGTRRDGRYYGMAL